MLKHRKAVMALLALAVAGVFVLPTSSASAGEATVSNACANSVTPNFSQIEVTTSGADDVDTVAPGGALTLNNLRQQAAIPGDIFVAGYNLGLLQQGENNIPANARSTIEATNTVQGSQNTNTVGGTPPNGSVTVTTFITDPDGTPGTGDETATDATMDVTYDDQSWTAGASGTIDYRQQSIATAPPTAANNTLLINALVGGVFNVQFRCAPGTVTGPDPGVISLIDPAASFDTTLIQEPEPTRQISISDASATEGGAETFTVSLDAASANPITVDFATADGTAVAPGDYTSATGTVTFAPGDTSETVTVSTIDDALVEGTETFDVNLSNATGNSAILDGMGVGTILDNDVAEPPRQISISDASATEGGAETFTVSLDAASANPITVDFATADGTAVAPGDYTSATGTVTFAPGDTSETVTVSTIDDALVEGTETFDVNLSNATGNSAILDGMGVGTILDNDVANQAPTANAGADQTVDEGASVTLDGSGSTDPDGDALTFAWTQTSGPAVTLTGADTANPTFTAPDVASPTTLEFQLEVCDPEPLCDTDTVVVTVNPVVAPIVDASGEVIVNGPVKAGQTAKTYVFRISNVGNTPITIDPTTEIAAAVLVNGVANGSVSSLTGTKTINPGARTRFRLRWTGTTPLATGDLVEFTADVNEPGDVDTTNDSDSATFGPLG
jgi:hypothetical protein